jgi:hypothetical protein
MEMEQKGIMGYERPFRGLCAGGIRRHEMGSALNHNTIFIPFSSSDKEIYKFINEKCFFHFLTFYH